MDFRGALAGTLRMVEAVIGEKPDNIFFTHLALQPQAGGPTPLPR